MKKLIIINGVPGVGKTTVCKKLYKQISRYSIRKEFEVAINSNEYIVAGNFKGNQLTGLLICYDDKLKENVALGIAELDQEVREGMLEWIQVLPSYRRRGLGCGIVFLYKK